ncbi:MAG: amidohydrolase, partial [bacterium]|nr:amidohydrolase [bacterium]
MLKYRVSVVVLAAVVAIGLTLACAPKDPADLVLVNGNIVTMDEGVPGAEAVAVRGDRIVAIGDEALVKKLIGKETQVIDLEGRLATPGLIESHAHFLSLGYALMRLDLTTAESWDDIVAKVEAAVADAEPGEWILGRGWHQEKWNAVPEPNVDGLPLHDALSAVSPENPVYLTHASGHSAIANAKAMELSGVNRRTAEPDGGEIVHDRRGNPIGVFRETAQGLIRRGMYEDQQDRTKESELAEQKRAAEMAANECLARGITSFHDAGVSFETVDFFRDLVDAGELPIRLYVMLSEGNEALAEKAAEYRMVGYGDNRLTVRAIKRLIDGALGSHGAWLLEPYDSLPSSIGLNTEPIEDMVGVAQIAVANDYQLCTHAIGDRGNRETLDIYQAALTPTGDTAAHRWRIEHSQHIHPDDLPRFAEMGVIAAMQGIHCTSDAPWVFKRLGEERAAS